MNKKTRKTVFYFFRIVLKQKPIFLLWFFMAVITEGSIPFINILFPKYLIDELMGGRNASRILILIALIVAGNSILGFLLSYAENRMERLHFWFKGYFIECLSMRAMSMPFADTENPEVLNQCHKADEGMDWYSGGLFGMANCFQKVISSVLTLIGVIVIVVNTSVLLFLLILASVAASSLIVREINKIDIATFEKGPVINRAFWYLGWKLCDARFGKDIRLYGADGMMLKRCDENFKEMNDVFKEQAEGTMRWGFVNALVSMFKNLGVYLYLGYRLIKGSISVASFTMLVTSSNSMRDSLQTMITQLQELQKKAGFMEAYREFMQTQKEEKAIGNQIMENSRECPLIEFKNVSFSYPGTGREVLSNVNIKILPGEHLSVVGLNGAGKTTFIKLLCRLYDVSDGEILMNGRNIKDFDIQEYRKILSVVFQDFKLFSLSIKENIILGNVKNQDEDIEHYIEISGLEEKVNSIHEGSDALLYKYFDEKGIEPSGGEAQKIAIARALYKDAPIVILDEPTAALDPVAEYEIYKQFDNLVGGKTAVYISHRLSSCKFCDKIAVFSNRTIEEYGTHEELLEKKNGVYSNMFQAQAQYYI